MKMKVKITPVSDMTLEMEKGENVYQFVAKIIRNHEMVEVPIKLQHYNLEILEK